MCDLRDKKIKKDVESVFENFALAEEHSVDAHTLNTIPSDDAVARAKDFVEDNKK